MQGTGRGGLRWLWPLVLGLLLVAGAAQAGEKMPQRVLRASADAAGVLDDDGNARVIVRYRSGSTLATELAASRRGAARLGGRLQLALEDGHVLGARSQSLRARGISPQALAARLAADADVEWAQPVRRKTVRAVVPNDPLYADNQAVATPAAGQWYLRAPDTTLVSAINAVGAWAITTGSASVTVAVIDTGVRLDHPDLAGKLWPGYDFVSRSTTANDGGGRDADPSDPGDWSTASDTCGAANSSWHGTQVAGLIGAATDNGIGIAGAGRDTMVLPVRVLGRCGGFDDDIIAGMRWAGGLSNAAGCGSGSTVSATCNPHPAQVLNLSLGSSGTCSNAYRQAIADLNAAGVTVVVASGNDTGHAVNEPANCAGALAVAGVRHAGTKVGYSNIGPQVAIAAPAGNCVNETGLCLYPLATTDNSGTTTPGANAYSSSISPSLGTSFATPLVAASAALLLAVDPTLTPALVRSTLQASARPFPTTGAQETTAVACRAPDAVDQIECYCTTSTCGAGLLDARAAVAAAAVPVAVISASTITPTAGDTVALGAAASRALGGRTMASYRWTISSGAGLASFVGATDSGTATLATSTAGTVVVQLTVTDSSGASRSVTQAVNITAAPVPVLSASALAPTVGDAVTLDAANSTVAAGRTISAYRWTVITGAGLASFDGAVDRSTARLTTSGAGQVQVQLTVTDSGGASRSNVLVINVTAAPVAVVGVSATTTTAGDVVDLESAASTVAPGRTVASYRWSITGGAGLASFVGATDGSSVRLQTSAAGAVVVQLTITDSSGVSASVTQSIAVAGVLVSASTSTPTVGDTVTLSGTDSSLAVGRTITGYRWAITSGAGLASFVGATDGSTASLATSGAGTVVVQLTVTDDTGAARSSSQTIAVAVAPVVVTPPPATSGGGGGALQAGWLLGLAVAVLLLWRGRPGRPGVDA